MRFVVVKEVAFSAYYQYFLLASFCSVCDKLIVHPMKQRVFISEDEEFVLQAYPGLTWHIIYHVIILLWPLEPSHASQGWSLYCAGVINMGRMLID